jgi:uncharacterized protein (DUF342 family)
MWAQAHGGIAGNERADFEAKQAISGNMVYNAQSVARDLLPVAKQIMLDEWQNSWKVDETGRFSHSIFPKCLSLDQVSRIISGTAELGPT